MDGVAVVIGLVLAVLLAGVVAYQIWFARRCERAIRGWADANGCAIIELGRWRLSPRPAGLLKTWRITVQDEQGGWRTGTVYFGSWLLDVPWGKMHIRWR